MSDFRFNVSDAVYVPLRGMLLRLKLVDGEPDTAQVKPGRKLRLKSPNGDERVVTIKDHSATGGRVTKKTLMAKRELDVIIPSEDATRDDEVVEIGWEAFGPVG
ncbi:MAG: hypothetical protein P8Z36_01810 [Gemmatimonadota bacterium]|jgi:hypothetical protein